MGRGKVKPSQLLEFSMSHYHHDVYCPTCEKMDSFCGLGECPLCYAGLTENKEEFTTQDAVMVVSSDYRKQNIEK